MIILLRPIHGTALNDWLKANNEPIPTMQVFLSKADQLKISLGVIPEEMDVETVKVRHMRAAPGNHVLINGKAYVLHYMKRGEYKLKKLRDV